MTNRTDIMSQLVERQAELEDENYGTESSFIGSIWDYLEDHISEEEWDRNHALQGLVKRIVAYNWGGF